MLEDFRYVSKMLLSIALFLPKENVLSCKWNVSETARAVICNIYESALFVWLHIIHYPLPPTSFDTTVIITYWTRITNGTRNAIDTVGRSLACTWPFVETYGDCLRLMVLLMKYGQPNRHVRIGSGRQLMEILKNISFYRASDFVWQFASVRK